MLPYVLKFTHTAEGSEVFWPKQTQDATESGSLNTLPQGIGWLLLCSSYSFGYPPQVHPHCPDNHVGKYLNWPNNIASLICGYFKGEEAWIEWDFSAQEWLFHHHNVIRHRKMIYNSSLDAWPILPSAKLIVVLKGQPAVLWLITV